MTVSSSRASDAQEPQPTAAVVLKASRDSRVDNTLAFVGIIAGKAFNADAEIDATIAGGLLAILGAIVAGILNTNIQKPKKPIESDDDDEY